MYVALDKPENAAIHRVVLHEMKFSRWVRNSPPTVRYEVAILLNISVLLTLFTTRVVLFGGFLTVGFKTFLSTAYFHKIFEVFGASSSLCWSFSQSLSHEVY